MVRSSTSAIVVPTASEEAKSDVSAPSVAEVQSQQYLQAAFHGHAPTEEHSEQSRSEAPDHEPGPPAIGKSLRQRSQSAVVQKQHAVELSKHYTKLVKDFRQLQPFTRRPDGTYPADTLCVYCANTRPTSVFFPCRHMCVCNDCIKSSKISTDELSSTNWCACPVCMADIRLILPHSGKEEERYWRWALEIKPNLPSHFKREFKQAGKRLNRNASPTRGSRNSFVAMFRRESTSPEAPKDPFPKANIPELERRHSWEPGEVAAAQNVAASNEQEEARNCSIL
ncbi:C3HC4 type zinc finger [Phytophthora infestans]|uniref:C3HC4 type zinc finger n=1 Tax=Phytophthora infestans TaxID=4787 RepID=A0A8S9TG26_PHYIN|nr:C3HC4 type zinc finger [Phytophthora infestans]